ncbi:Aste57867_20539 [Aphanomyces stellatus]|uniref:dCMP deaminase n=1 Tax=Aphanomyces stellatus TaxID=120398 RepID=A0A485KHJ6_9STRA|nr:hypothetical protein As57867_020472 [Aphanomyces stellatus]KAF0709744.1 hypothetical protein As57867_005761 [Aphanomyces stellatus]VFT82799.1 Aste57867_5775 [Aphanomyces stellatus]VFT97224.1 Aste57867_20539 [Aphanomyces stellatus]
MRTKRKRDMEVALNESTTDVDAAETSHAKVVKRQDYLSWDDYFMSVAFLSSMRSKDPSTQVGACIVNSEKKIVGIGYNGFPNGCDDDVLPWARQAESPLDTKYPYVCHAEMNAILNKNATSVKGCTIYVALFPCNECAKLIIQASMEKFVFSTHLVHRAASRGSSIRLTSTATNGLSQHHGGYLTCPRQVQCIQHEMKTKSLVIDFSQGPKKKHRLQALENGITPCSACAQPCGFLCEGCSDPDHVVAFCGAHLSDCYLDHLGA